ncbi:hypothetical protein ACROYT_G035185 [Oculina patagonica]
MQKISEGYRLAHFSLAKSNRSGRSRYPRCKENGEICENCPYSPYGSGKFVVAPVPCDASNFLWNKKREKSRQNQSTIYNISVCSEQCATEMDFT